MLNIKLFGTKFNDSRITSGDNSRTVSHFDPSFDCKSVFDVKIFKFQTLCSINDFTITHTSVNIQNQQSDHNTPLVLGIPERSLTLKARRRATASDLKAASII